MHSQHTTEPPLLAMMMCDPRVDPIEKPRLTRQCQEILDVLRRGDATNKRLSEISLKYTSRISDLRQSGYPVYVVSRDHHTGIVWYSLTDPVQAVS